MPREPQFTVATWEENRRQQHRDFMALPFRRKLEIAEQFGEVAAFFAGRRRARGLPVRATGAGAETPGPGVTPGPVAGLIVAAAVLLSLATPVRAQSLDNLAFMAGCWEGEYASGDGPGVIEEHYTSPSANLMLGTTRYLADGEATFFELTRIERTADGVVLTPYPGGAQSEHGFRLVRAGGGEATFEAPEHDFPKRILYRIGEDGSLTARIDAGEGSERSREWTMRRVACP